MGPGVGFGGGGKLLGFHLREEEDFLYAGLTGEEHGEAVDADAEAGGGWHAVFEGAEEVVVDEHGFVVASLAEAELLFEALALVEGIVELGVGVGDFFAVDNEFESLGELWVVAVFFTEGRHFDGVIDDEGGLDEVGFAFFAKDGVDEFGFAHFGGDVDVELVTGLAELVFVHTGDVDAGVSANGFVHGDAWVGGFEVDGVFAEEDLCAAVVDGFGDVLKEVFGELHHPVVVFVGYIDFHAGKFGIVGAVHAFVSEVFGKFVHAFEAAYNEALEVELICYAEVEGYVECVVMGDEGAGRGSAGDGLENGGFDLEISEGIEILAHGLDDTGSFDEDVFDVGVDDEVYVAHAVALFGVGKGVVYLTLCIYFYNGQGAEGFAQKGKSVYMDGELTHLCAEHIAFDSDEVAYVDVFFNDFVVEGLVVGGTNLVALEVYLDFAGGVFQVEKGGFAH